MIKVVVAVFAAILLGVVTVCVVLLRGWPLWKAGERSVTGLAVDPTWRLEARAHVVVTMRKSRKKYQTVTDPAGMFRVTGLPDGAFTVRSADGRRVGEAFGVLSSQSPHALVRLMVAAAGAGSITGRVTDPSSGPVRGAVVVATFAESQLSVSTTTDAAGAYRLEGLPPLGNLTLTARTAEGRTGMAASYLIAGAPARQTDVPLPPAGQVEPELTNRDFNAGLRGWTTTGQVSVRPGGSVLSGPPVVPTTPGTPSQLPSPTAPPTAENTPTPRTTPTPGITSTPDPSAPVTAPAAFRLPAAKEPQEGAVVVATQGGTPGSIAQSFKVTDGRLTGTLRFLSAEWPRYYGSQYNDAYAVILTTPDQTMVLATGNLNASSWLPGRLGFNGMTPEVPLTADLSLYRGKAVTLQLSVWNVADELYPSGLLLSALVPASGQCEDADLVASHGARRDAGTDRGLGRPAIDTWDANLDGRAHPGTDLSDRFTALVKATADAVGIDPGLLAANAMVEHNEIKTYLQPEPLSQWRVGLDTWESRRAEIEKDVKLASPIVTKRTGDLFEQEKTKDGKSLTVPVVNFSNGPNALLAMAAYLKHVENDLQRQVGSAAWSRLSDPDRFELVRIGFNRPATASALAQQAAAGKSIVVPSGPTTEIVTESDGTRHRIVHPQRSGTVTAAQAVHLSQKFFGTHLRCQ
ncbi:carboxypeptidase regulatory-like domain-containing protein [Actinomadura nitritigenes]|uniref:carboxypeptidase regulatory-like domain-containing protein n=1 Tax=Actinomadura nitritigenes TaxID=134602 RepID=UPI003D921A86